MNPMDLPIIREVLVSARELLSDKSKWTQGAYAKNTDGVAIFSTSPNAVCFCAVGAVSRQAYALGEERGIAHWAKVDLKSAALDHLNRVASAKFGSYRSAIEVNDDLGYKSTLKLLDCAIEEEYVA